MKQNRNHKEVNEALAALTKCAETGEGNLLDLSIKAARVRASLGEISFALEKIWGRFQAVTRTISGVYSSEYATDDEMFDQEDDG